MKKTLVLLSLITFAAPVFAEAFFAPEWREFSPASYVNLDTEKNYKQESKKYWADRKRTFEKRAEHCNQLPAKSHEACYAEVRKLEYKANETCAKFVQQSLQQQSILQQSMIKSHYIYHQ